MGVLVGVAVFGFVIAFVGLPDHGLHSNIVELGWFAAPVSIFWLLGMQNTVNFLDGVDGLAAGVVMIVALTLLIAAAGTRGSESRLAGQLAGALAGTCAGFRSYQFYPAKIFMGGSCSHVLSVA